MCVCVRRRLSGERQVSQRFSLEVKSYFAITTTSPSEFLIKKNCSGTRKRTDACGVGIAQAIALQLKSSFDHKLTQATMLKQNSVYLTQAMFLASFAAFSPRDFSIFSLFSLPNLLKLSINFRAINRRHLFLAPFA